jgi:hypothetical protein
LTGFEQQALVLAMKEARHLLGYIRRLSVNYFRWVGDPNWSAEDSVDEEEKGMVTAQLLPVVRAMEHVTSIDFGYIDFGDSKRCPKYVRTLTSLVAHMKEELPFNASVRSVSLAYPHPVAILACLTAFPGLQVLELGRSFFQDQVNWALNVTDVPKVVLKQLSFHAHSQFHPLLAKLQSYPQAMAQLQVLDITMPPTTQASNNDGPSVNSILAVCGRVLEHLHVRTYIRFHTRMLPYSAYTFTTYSQSIDDAIKCSSVGLFTAASPADPGGASRYAVGAALHSELARGCRA